MSTLAITHSVPAAAPAAAEASAPLTDWKLLSLLLDHPSVEVIGARDDLLAAACLLPSGPVRDGIVTFARAFAEGDGSDWEATYVRTFDFSRRTSLELSYFVHGDRRQRGVALLKLKRVFDALGLELATDELPDYLPLLLEVADIAGDEVGRTLLGDFRPGLEVVAAALEQAESPYASLLQALLALLGPLSDEDAAAALHLAKEGPPDEAVGLHPFAPPEVMPESCTTTGVAA
jgi:nitrate reductase delta subunit